MWTQYTYVDGELAYEPKERTTERMLELFAQLHFLRQAGETIVVGANTDAKYTVTEYTVIRQTNSKTLFYRFVKGEEE